MKFSYVKEVELELQRRRDSQSSELMDFWEASNSLTNKALQKLRNRSERFGDDPKIAIKSVCNILSEIFDKELSFEELPFSTQFLLTSLATDSGKSGYAESVFRQFLPKFKKPKPKIYYTDDGQIVHDNESIDVAGKDVDFTCVLNGIRRYVHLKHVNGEGGGQCSDGVMTERRNILAACKVKKNNLKIYFAFTGNYFTKDRLSNLREYTDAANVFVGGGEIIDALYKESQGSKNG